MQIGAKVRRLRTQRGLTMEELADRCELSKGFISLLERDLTSPSIATLSDILECLGTDLASFFDERPEEKVCYTDEDMFVKEDAEGLCGSIKWLVPNAQKNRMEPILVEMQSGGSTTPENPHEGEEFGFVLQGSINLHLGERKIRVRREESFCFKPDQTHYIENAGKSVARVLWVSTPPTF